MASTREPRNPLEKRDLLHAESPDQGKVDAVAAKLLAENRYAEAVDYIEITRSAPLVAQLGERALQVGSPFLLSQVERLTGEKRPESDWRAVAEGAQKAERWMDAVRALQGGGFEDEAEALRQDKCPEYEPFKPQNK